MFSIADGVNAVGRAPPSCGRGEGCICDHRFLPTLPKFTVALPCARALSLAIISSVSGPGVNPSEDSSSPAASAGVAATTSLPGVTPEGIFITEGTGAVTGSSPPPPRAACCSPIVDVVGFVSQVSAVIFVGAVMFDGAIPVVSPAVSPPTVAASEGGCGASPCAPSFILRSMRMVSSPAVSKPLLCVAVTLVIVCPSDSVRGLSHVSEERAETPFVLTEAAATSAPGGISKESERLRSTSSFFGSSRPVGLNTAAVMVGVLPEGLPP